MKGKLVGAVLALFTISLSTFWTSTVHTLTNFKFVTEIIFKLFWSIVLHKESYTVNEEEA